MLIAILWISLSVAAAALAMTIWNLQLYHRAPNAAAIPESVTVCIPARNEESNIEACIRAALDTDHAQTLALVYDDQSTDLTSAILERLRVSEQRLSLCPVQALPAGWVGKQHACDRMGRHAQTDWLLFIDADVRLTRDCIRRSLAAAAELKAAMLSTFPRQITGSLGESLLVPMIHFVLLSYLPFVRMRRTSDPAASAACGQFILIRRDAYLAAGGHAAVRDSMHDGVKLPRVLRRAGFRTDLFDGTDVASCRMYTGFLGTWRGFAKNAYEGLGSPILLLLLTALHLLGHMLPWVVLSVALARAAIGFGLEPLRPMHIVLAGLCVLLNIVQRSLLARRFCQNWIGVPLHPIAVLMMTLVQWHSLVLQVTGQRSWRGRAAAASAIQGVAVEGASR